MVVGGEGAVRDVAESEICLRADEKCQLWAAVLKERRVSYLPLQARRIEARPSSVCLFRRREDIKNMLCPFSARSAQRSVVLGVRDQRKLVKDALQRRGDFEEAANMRRRGLRGILAGVGRERRVIVGHGHPWRSGVGKGEGGICLQGIGGVDIQSLGICLTISFYLYHISPLTAS